MLPKPNGCLGCPLYDDGKGFVADEIVPGAEVFVMLQNPGSEEEVKGRPAVGATGDELNNVYLPTAGLTRGLDVSIGNAIRCRWRDPATKKKFNKIPTGKVLSEAIAHCRRYDAIPAEVRWIVAAGSAAAQACNVPGKVTEWRGFPSPNTVRVGRAS